MTRPLLIRLPGNAPLVNGLASVIGADVGRVAIRRFPDGETYLRYETPIAGRSLVLLCALDRPDDKFLPLAFAAAAARDLGATRVDLVAPYLAYMRQDRRFQQGEAVTSAYFAKLLSGQIDSLVTVDPHLHRRSSLAEIYSIPTQVLHAAPLISEWIRNEVKMPLLIGPDSESEQWVVAVARDAGVPYVVLQKRRHGDRDVDVSVPDVARWRDHTPPIHGLLDLRIRDREQVFLAGGYFDSGQLVFYQARGEWVCHSDHVTIQLRNQTVSVRIYAFELGQHVAVNGHDVRLGINPPGNERQRVSISESGQVCELV